MVDIKSLGEGRRREVARAITMVENGAPGYRRLLREIFPRTGSSSIIGITGPAGAGKSSLINGISMRLAEGGGRPAVLAVDPTSHITGGAILGDRVRMISSTDSGVYIRSVASRGATGAVAGSLHDIIRVLEYAGFDPIIIESVGAGQTEVGIADIADLTVVVFNPHTGDSIQAIKAGITEIGDIYVINKADLPGSDPLYDAVREFMGGQSTVLKTSVKEDTGITELACCITDMLPGRRDSRDSRRRAALRGELRNIVLRNVQERVDVMIDKYIEPVRAGRMDPHQAADFISESILR